MGNTEGPPAVENLDPRQRRRNMAHWDDYRRSREEQDRGRRNPDEEARNAGGQERRSFSDQERFSSDQARYGAGGRGGRGGRGEGEDEAWRRDRYGSRFDQDRTNYGSGYDRDQGGYGRGQQGGGYGGQEYGMEGRGGQTRRNAGDDLGYASRRGGGDDRETWRPSQGAPYGDLEMNARNRGVQEYGQPADYAAHPQAGHEFEPDYLRWRDQQMKGHDRDYQDWRRHQHEQYDNDYRKFRAEKRSPVGGAPDQSLSPGVGGYGDKTGAGGVYAGTSSDKPTGMIDQPGHVASSPTMTQTGGAPGQASAGAQANAGAASSSGGSATGGSASGGSGGSEFGKEPPQVRAAADGDVRRSDDKAKDKDTERDDKRH
jgi:hypothetical protein